MEYYLPSRKKTRIRFKRKRSRKPVWLFGLCALLLTVFFWKPDMLPLDRAKSLVQDQAEEIFTTETTPSGPQEPSQRLQLEPIKLPEALKKAQSRKSPDIQEKVLSISSGDTLIKVLVEAGLSRQKAHELISATEEVFSPRRIKQGNEIVLAHKKTDQESEFHEMRLKLDVSREIVVENCSQEGYLAREIEHQFESRPVLAEAEINSSLYQAAIQAGIPLPILWQAIQAYSFSVDFQRDIRPGDSIEMVYQEKIDEHGDVVKSGSVLHATLNTGDRELPIYRYQTDNGQADFFDPQGESVRKTLMVTPIDGARVSSGYGQRTHPIQGYSHFHPGLDFAAPHGTPIMAAGDGVVEYAGRKGGYGHYIRIRHPNEYKTVYAHMSRYASGISQGARMQQGETIGYVGTTGNATGPHLHYEVLRRGEHVNPAEVDTPSTRTLEGEELERFLEAKRDLDKLHASLQDRKKMARKD